MHSKITSLLSASAAPRFLSVSLMIILSFFVFIRYMYLIKSSLWIQKEISLQIYFFGKVYFFRYVKISSTLENNCAYTVDSFTFSGGRGCFSALLVSAVTQEYSSFISTNLSMFSFPIQDFFLIS